MPTNEPLGSTGDHTRHTRLLHPLEEHIRSTLAVVGRQFGETGGHLPYEGRGGWEDVCRAISKKMKGAGTGGGRMASDHVESTPEPPAF